MYSQHVHAFWFEFQCIDQFRTSVNLPLIFDIEFFFSHPLISHLCQFVWNNEHVYSSNNFEIRLILLCRNYFSFDWIFVRFSKTFVERHWNNEQKKRLSLNNRYEFQHKEEKKTRYVWHGGRMSSKNDFEHAKQRKYKNRKVCVIFFSISWSLNHSVAVEVLKKLSNKKVTLFICTVFK